MDQRPRHGEVRYPVALGGDEKLLDRGFRTTPPKADQDTPRGVEDAPVLWVERHLRRNPVCRHVFSYLCDDHTDPRPTWPDTPSHAVDTPAPAQASERACARSALSIIFVPKPVCQSMARLGMRL